MNSSELRKELYKLDDEHRQVIIDLYRSDLPLPEIIKRLDEAAALYRSRVYAVTFQAFSEKDISYPMGARLGIDTFYE